MLAWFAFPLAPAILGDAYQRWFGGDAVSKYGSPDPLVWDWQTWLILAGPLVGYGFLAGATSQLGDEPRSGQRGGRWWRWLSRRSIWVGIGPWVGFLFWAGLLAGLALLPVGREWTDPKSIRWFLAMGAPGGGNAAVTAALSVAFYGSLAYGWLLVAIAALRRASRQQTLRQALWRGTATAAGFIGSLFATFWAVVSSCRPYFFDPRIMPLLLAAVTLVLTSGCAQTITYGEARRRELFQALLMAWLIGLALVWRWWSRSRSRPAPRRPERDDRGPTT
jgi:hypothetical protein